MFQAWIFLKVCKNWVIFVKRFKVNCCYKEYHNRFRDIWEDLELKIVPKNQRWAPIFDICAQTNWVGKVSENYPKGAKTNIVP